jgi:uncharacterized protein (UPF0276 family)
MILSKRTDRGYQVRPGLGMTYECHNPALLERVLPLVDYLEVTPDALAQSSEGEVFLQSAAIAELQNASKAVKLIVHGVGLSIASHEGWSEQYVRLLDDFMEQLDVVWHSEHLGYTRVDGEHLGTMLAPPKTVEALDLICERVCRLQARYGKPFLIENIVHLLPDPPGDYTDAEFLNLLAAQTGCSFILDVYNLECDAQNYCFDIPGFLADLNLGCVHELHVACGVEYRGFLLDVHSRPTRESTVALAQRVIKMAEGGVEVITYELLSEAVPVLGDDAIVSELKRLRAVLCS